MSLPRRPSEDSPHWSAPEPMFRHPDLIRDTRVHKPMALHIEDYGLIGDTQTVALVGRDGSMDWLCLPRFDAGACFAALLGDRRHGRWLIAPRGGQHASRRCYRGDSLVLEQEFGTPSGSVRVIDCMPPRHREPDVVPVVEGVSGNVEMSMELIVRSITAASCRGSAPWTAPFVQSAGLTRCHSGPLFPSVRSISRRRPNSPSAPASAWHSCWRGTRHIKRPPYHSLPRTPSVTRRRGGRNGRPAAPTMDLGRMQWSAR